MVADAYPRRIFLLYLAVFCSCVDRLAIAPLLLVISLDLAVPLPAVTMMATAYLVAYGSMQVVWGIISDRLGRIRTMRLALTIAAVAGVGTALAPTLGTLVASRLIAGGAHSAIVPGALIYVGDTVPIDRRHAPLTDLMTATAIGTSSGVLLGATIAEVTSWRVAFALPSILALGLTVLMRSVPEPATARSHEPVRARFGRVLHSRWALLVIGFAFIEGTVLLGVLNYLPSTLQHGGMGTAASGMVTSVYGVGVVVFARVVKVLSGRLPATRLIAVGGVLGSVAYVSLVADQGITGVLTGTVLLAGTWAFMHSSMQKWVTEVAPLARATSVSLFASALFLGSAASTAFGAAYANQGNYRSYFTVGLVVTVALAVSATVMHARSRQE